MRDSAWSVVENGFDLSRLHHMETVFTLGNGYLSTRGAFEEGFTGAWPISFIHGVYDLVPIFYTELANCPNWLPLVVVIDGARFGLEQGKVLGYRRELDMRRGLLIRRVRWQSPAGHTVDLGFERLVSLADPHVLAVRLQVTPVDYEGPIEVQAGLNGYQDNDGLMHWDWVDQGLTGDSVWLHVSTRRSAIELAMAATLRVAGDPGARVRAMGCQGYPTLAAAFTGRPGQTVTLDKVVTVFTLRETSTPAQAARVRLAEQPAYPTLRAAHQAAWEAVWASSDVEIEGDAQAQVAVRFNLFQLLVAAPRLDEWSSIPAKTLSGYGYRGHVFWDTDIFIVPFLAYTQPALARNLLSYRFHTLPGARRKARAGGYEGAMFAWESAATGDEVTPRWLTSADGSELIRIWSGDIELHITTDVAYAAWTYWRASADDSWMMRHGAELVLDTAVFWACRVEYNAARGCYEIRDVIGPDEYHEHVDNNAFTNRMVQWHLATALDVLAWLRRTDPEQAAALESRLDLTDERLRHWADVAGCLFVPYDPQTGLIEQFQGFFDLEDIDLAAYEPRAQSMQSLLGIQGANARQVLKQADVLMLLYLLSDHYDLDTLRTNWDYYAPRTDHTFGSSLGPAIHGILAGRLGKAEEAYEHFMRAAVVDLEDVRGNAADGIHAASAGGLWQALIFGFAGIRLTPNGPVAEPRLPAGWTRLKFRLQYGGQWFEFDLGNQTELVAKTGEEEPAPPADGGSPHGLDSETSNGQERE